MDPTEIGQRTRGERLAEATGAPRTPAISYRDAGSGKDPRWPVNPPERESAPAPVERHNPGVATDPIGVVLMVALVVALILVAAGEFTVAYFLAHPGGT